MANSKRNDPKSEKSISTFTNSSKPAKSDGEYKREIRGAMRKGKRRAAELPENRSATLFAKSEFLN